MVQFDKLRLSGFKSFVDPTELAIEPGMTGIVGPNGCGKSNLVEAHEVGDGRDLGQADARQRDGGRHLLRRRHAAGAQHRRGHADARQQDAHRAGDGERFRPARHRAPHRARPRLGLFGERPRDPRPRRADAVCRCRHRLALDRAGEPGPHRHADQRQARSTGAPSSTKPPASPASMPAATRPSSGCAPPSRTWPACRTCWWRSRSSTRG